ncbi:hypothetical protein BLNAU_3890 [Blattamonas nauphoetae]|uniref:Uncharacterized protein n=1 Tax=Blattamonas nauphoetae TaxID=2049346 RepID=A0ABQ9YBH9_9EUKA|nr:hypothetical protein BLNAU_3890 [Blattamonas nauphoetae]
MDVINEDDQFDTHSTSSTYTDDDDVINIILGKPDVPFAESKTNDHFQQLPESNIQISPRVVLYDTPHSALVAGTLNLRPMAGQNIIRKTEADTLSPLHSRHGKPQSAFERLYAIHEEKMLNKLLSEDFKEASKKASDESMKSPQKPNPNGRNEQLYRSYASQLQKREEHRQKVIDAEKKEHHPLINDNSRQMADSLPVTPDRLGFHNKVTPKPFHVIHAENPPPPPPDDPELTFRPNIDDTFYLQTRPISPLKSNTRDFTATSTDMSRTELLYSRRGERSEAIKKAQKKWIDYEKRENGRISLAAKAENEQLCPGNSDMFTRTQMWEERRQQKLQQTRSEIRERERNARIGEVYRPSRKEDETRRRKAEQENADWMERTAGAESFVERLESARKRREKPLSYNKQRQYPPPPTRPMSPFSHNRENIKSLKKPVSKFRSFQSFVEEADS